MLRILHDTKIDFIRLWKITTVVTLLFIVPGLLWIGVSSYRYSIEFTGGTLMQVRFAQAPNVADVRSTLDQAGIKGAEITQFGTDLDYLVRAQEAANSYDNDGRKEGIRQFIDEKSYKPGLASYDVSKQANKR